MTTARIDGRKADQLRTIKVTRDFIPVAEGSVLFEIGNTRVICNASVEEGVPGFLRGKGTGWVTAEYSMLPRATRTRTSREVSRGKAGGRTLEIQRLIGRSLRAIIDMKLLGERTIWVDCDVIEADGGTRCASVTGAYMALHDACWSLVQSGDIESYPLTQSIAAISVGTIEGKNVLDLNYEEDSSADVDMNVITTGDGRFIELQGTAEKSPFDKAQLDALLTLAGKGIDELTQLQKSYESGA